MNHTPGPWRVSDGYTSLYPGHLDIVQGKDYKPGRYIVIAETMLVEGKDCGDFESNARLIAAAPELLAALKVANAAYSETEKLLQTTPDDAPPNVKQVRAAIAKAEGRT